VILTTGSLLAAVAAAMWSVHLARRTSEFIDPWWGALTVLYGGTALCIALGLLLAIGLIPSWLHRRHGRPGLIIGCLLLMVFCLIQSLFAGAGLLVD
jgi:hypothetical protein